MDTRRPHLQPMPTLPPHSRQPPTLQSCVGVPGSTTLWRCRGVLQPFSVSDVNKDWTCKDKDKDKDQAYKDQDKDKD